MLDVVSRSAPHLWVSYVKIEKFIEDLRTGKSAPDDTSEVDGAAGHTIVNSVINLETPVCGLLSPGGNPIVTRILSVGGRYTLTLINKEKLRSLVCIDGQLKDDFRCSSKSKLQREDTIS